MLLCINCVRGNKIRHRYYEGGEVRGSPGVEEVKVIVYSVGQKWTEKQSASIVGYSMMRNPSLSVLKSCSFLADYALMLSF